jgi:hypothetical protein
MQVVNLLSRALAPPFAQLAGDGRLSPRRRGVRKPVCATYHDVMVNEAGDGVAADTLVFRATTGLHVMPGSHTSSRRDTVRLDAVETTSPAHGEWLLDEALMETFPASDPVSPATQCQRDEDAQRRTVQARPRERAA